MISVNFPITDTIANVGPERKHQKVYRKNYRKEKECPKRKENTGNIVRLGHQDRTSILSHHVGKSLSTSSKTSCVFCSYRHIDYIVTFLLRFQLSTSPDHIISSPSLRLHLLIHFIFMTRDTSFDCFTPMAMKRNKPFVNREFQVEGPKPEDWIKLGGIVTSTNPQFKNLLDQNAEKKFTDHGRRQPVISRRNNPQ